MLVISWNLLLILTLFRHFHLIYYYRDINLISSTIEKWLKALARVLETFKKKYAHAIKPKWLLEKVREQLKKV